MKLVRPLRVAGLDEPLPIGRCLQVVQSDAHGYWVVLDENDEHLYFRKDDPRLIEATREDMAREPD